MPEINLSLDGAPITAAPGQTVGAALTAAGVTSWRSTAKKGRPRGLFCGIGICFDCLVTADGVPNQRACITPAREGMKVDTNRGEAQNRTAAGSVDAGVETSLESNRGESGGKP